MTDPEQGNLDNNQQQGQGNQQQMAQGGPDQGGPDQGGPDQGGPDQGGPDQGGPDQGGPDQEVPASQGEAVYARVNKPAQGGPAQGGPAQGGPAHGGPAQEGYYAEMPGDEEGPDQEGPGQEGYYAEMPGDEEGPAQEGPAQEGYYAEMPGDEEGPDQEGHDQEGYYAEMPGYGEVGEQEGGYAEQPGDRGGARQQLYDPDFFYPRETYILPGGDDVREFEEGRWPNVRTAIVDCRPINPEDLLTEGPVFDIANKIVQSRGNLSEDEVHQIVGMLQSDQERVANEIGEPVQCCMSDFPIIGRNKCITTLLHLAYAFNVDQRIIAAIEGVDMFRDIYSTMDAAGNYPLHYAAKNCTEDNLQRCVTNTPETLMHSGNAFGESPFNILAKNEHCSTKALDVMVERGALLAYRDGDLKCALHHFGAAAQGKVVLALANAMSGDPLVAEQMKKQDRQGKTPMHYVAMNPNIDSKYFKAIHAVANTDLNLQDAQGQTPLVCAAYSNNGRLVSTLIKCGSDVNVPDAGNRTALHYAVMSGHKEAIGTILRHPNVNCSKRDYLGYTPLHHAIVREDANATRALADVGKVSPGVKESMKASLLLESSLGDSPLNLACAQNNPKIVKDLCKAISRHHSGNILQAALVRENAVEGEGLDVSDLASCDVVSGKSDVHMRAMKAVLPTSPVLTAIKCDNPKALQAIVSSTSEDILQQTSSSGITSCQLAVLCGSDETVRCVVKGASSADINGPGGLGFTPLHLACLQNRAGLLEALISNQHLDVNQRMGPNGNTVLHVAVSRGNTGLVKQLLRNPNIDVNTRNANGVTPLHCAAQLGDVKSCRYLIRSGVDVNARDNEGKSIISCAISPENKEYDVLRILYALKGAGLDIGGQEDVILQKCIECGYNQVLESCLDTGINAEVNLTLPIVTAVERGNLYAASRLLDVGCDVNTKSDVEDHQNHGCSLLMIAAMNQDYKMMKLLLSKGCDITASGPELQTVSHMLAVDRNQPFVEKSLKEIKKRNSQDLGNAFSAQDEFGNTPLHCAIQEGNNQFVFLALKRILGKRDMPGVLSVKNSLGHTVLHEAVNTDNVHLVKSLLKSVGSKRRLADIASVQDNQGKTVLHLAVESGNVEMANLLLKNIDRTQLSNVMRLRDEHGNTVLHSAANVSGLMLKSVKNSVSKSDIKGIVGIRNNAGNTAAHLALKCDNPEAYSIVRLCGDEAFLAPNRDGQLLSHCVNQGSDIAKSKMFGLKASKLSKIISREAKVRQAAASASFSSGAGDGVEGTVQPAQQEQAAASMSVLGAGGSDRMSLSSISTYDSAAESEVGEGLDSIVRLMPTAPSEESLTSEESLNLDGMFQEQELQAEVADIAVGMSGLSMASGQDVGIDRSSSQAAQKKTSCQSR